MLKIFRSKYLNPWEDYRSMETTTETEPAISELESLSRTRLAECYQCGKCTAGCPTAAQMDIPPTRLIRLLQLGDSESALRAGSIWQCVSCQTHPRVQVIQCVDPGGQTPDWSGEIGFVPTVFERAQVPAGGAVSLVIGPPIMIKATIPVLERMGARMSDVYTSLENRMKCGVGKCGRCHAGPVYVCKEGPVFTFQELHAMPMDY
jgi:ferredoxin